MEQKKKSVLLVDDDALCNTVNRIVLEKTNMVEDVETISNGYEAVHLLESKLKKQQPMPDLLLLDLNMPFMNGFEFLSTIQKHFAIDHQQLDIIILSSSFDPRDKERTVAMGISQYIEKPLSVSIAIKALS